jgi:hypothetical protein
MSYIFVSFNFTTRQVISVNWIIITIKTLFFEAVPAGIKYGNETPEAGPATIVQ